MKKAYGILVVIAVLLIAAAYAYSYTLDARPASKTAPSVSMPYVDAGAPAASEDGKKSMCGPGGCDKSAKGAADYKGKCGSKKRDASKTGEKKNGGIIVETA